jgi:hypothetical protein
MVQFAEAFLIVMPLCFLFEICKGPQPLEIGIEFLKNAYYFIGGLILVGLAALAICGIFALAMLLPQWIVLIIGVPLLWHALAKILAEHQAAKIAERERLQIEFEERLYSAIYDANHRERF